MPTLSWADRVRGSSVSNIVNTRRICTENVLSPPNDSVRRERRSGCSTSRVPSDIPRKLAPDLWDIICSYLGICDVNALSITCSFLWRLLQHHDNVWRLQIEYFRNDMKDLYDEERLLCTKLFTPAPRNVYEQMKFEFWLYVMDARREWTLKCQETACGRDYMFSCPLTLAYEPPPRVEDGCSTPLHRLRVVRAIRLSSTGGPTSEGAHHGDPYVPSIFTPSEYMTLCENINHGDFTGSRLGVQDYVDEESRLLQVALMQTLRRAKRRGHSYCSMGGMHTRPHIVLRHFSGLLLSICRCEANEILESLLHKRDLIENFMMLNDSSTRRSSGSPSGSLPPPLSRYYIAPELCEQGRVALIIVDSVRMLVVVGQERVTRDGARWGTNYRH